MLLGCSTHCTQNTQRMYNTRVCMDRLWHAHIHVNLHTHPSQTQLHTHTHTHTHNAHTHPPTTRGGTYVVCGSASLPPSASLGSTLRQLKAWPHVSVASRHSGSRSEGEAAATSGRHINSYNGKDG